MGMYTELNFNARLKSDTPYHIIIILENMCEGQNKDYFKKLPDHPLFKTSRWNWMLRCDSFYFDATTHSEMKTEHLGDENLYFLNIQCNLKNYDREIELFLNWIEPYLYNKDKFLGYKRYEENLGPTLLYLSGEKIIEKKTKIEYDRFGLSFLGDNE